MGVILFVGAVMFRLIFLFILICAAICAAILVWALIVQLAWKLGKWLTDRMEDWS